MRLFEIISLITYSFSKIIPKKKNRWIFGAWFGNAVSDNTKAFFDYISENHPEIEKIWISSDPMKVNLPGTKVAKRNSLSSLKYILNAEVAIMNQGFGDFAAFNFLGGTKKVQLWHGVAWKKIGLDAFPEMRGISKRVFQILNHYDLFIAPSEEYGRIIKKAFGANDNQIVYVGQPRNQCLFNNSFCEDCHEHILNKAEKTEQKIIVYMPTFRDKTEEIFRFSDPHIAPIIGEIAERLGFILVEKTHYKTKEKEVLNLRNNHIFQMPNEDAQVLLGAADILITDYSSCFFDFLIRNKPIIHYIYDFDYYKNKDRGVYYNIDEVACGSVAFKEDELFKFIEKNMICDTEEELRKMMRKKFIQFESVHNSEVLYEQIIERL